MNGASVLAEISSHILRSASFLRRKGLLTFFVVRHMVGRNEHERRIREAIAFLNEEEQARIQDVPDKERIGEL